MRPRPEYIEHSQCFIKRYRELHEEYRRFQYGAALDSLSFRLYNRSLNQKVAVSDALATLWDALNDKRGLELDPQSYGTEEYVAAALELVERHRQVVDIGPQSSVVQNNSQEVLDKPVVELLYSSIEDCIGELERLEEKTKGVTFNLLFLDEGFRQLHIKFKNMAMVLICNWIHLDLDNTPNRITMLKDVNRAYIRTRDLVESNDESVAGADTLKKCYRDALASIETYFRLKEPALYCDTQPSQSFFQNVN